MAEEKKRVAEQERIDREAEEKERKRLLKQAERAEKKGDTEKAEELKEEAENVVVVTPTVTAPETPEGVSYRDDWYAEVPDIKILCKAIAEGKAPVNYIMANMPVLNKQAKATKDMLKVPGVKFLCRKVQMNRR